jgi:CubicO group peptidase (beta-lactamase class C family)
MARGITTSVRGAVAPAMWAGAAIAVLALSPVAARAEALPGAAAAFDAAYKDWAHRHRIAQGVLAVAHGDKMLLLRGYGGLDPKAAVPLASLSKAITGACVATLVRDGKLSLGTRLGDVLSPLFKRQGAPADLRVKAITIEQLLTHRSGFSRSANSDPASGNALVAHLRDHDSGKPGIEAAMARALTYRLVRPPGQTYEYVNANYLILGAVIEQAAGRPYEEYCRDAVLRPLGATGKLGPKWAALSAYGGWSLTATDYLKFFHAFDRGSGLADAATWRWMMTPGGKSMGKSADAHYALGMVVRRDPSGPTFVHTGLWTHAQSDAAGGPLADSHATLAVKSGDGVAWFVFMAPQPPKDARAALDRALWRAHDSVRWPAPQARPQVRTPTARASARRD